MSQHSCQMWHFTVLVYLAHGYHDSEVALLTSVSVISATISSSLKTRISKSSDPTRSWKEEEPCVFTSTSKHGRISRRETKEVHNTYTLLPPPKSSNLPIIWFSGRYLLLGKSTPSVSEEKVATTDLTLPCGLHILPGYGLPPNTWARFPAQCCSLPADGRLFQRPETGIHGQETGKWVPSTALGLATREANF